MSASTLGFIYFVGYLVSVLLSIGWNYADAQARWPYIAKTSWREQMGFSIIWSVIAQCLWPVMLPGIYCMTGFAEHGWHLRRPA